MDFHQLIKAKILKKIFLALKLSDVVSLRIKTDMGRQVREFPKPTLHEKYTLLSPGFKTTLSTLKHWDTVSLVILSFV